MRLERNRIIGKSDGWIVVRSVQCVCVCARGKGHDFRDWAGQLKMWILKKSLFDLVVAFDDQRII